MTQLEKVLGEARRRVRVNGTPLNTACALAAVTVTDDVVRAAELAQMAEAILLGMSK